MTTILHDIPVSTPLPEQFNARILGKVMHRVGDGPTEDVPVGQDVRVDVALASMVLSWMSEGQPVTVAVARDEFMFYMDEGHIALQA